MPVCIWAVQLSVLLTIFLSSASAQSVVSSAIKTSRIIGGSPVRDVNFHVGIRIVRGENVVTGCPGTVLRRRWVITAAHCFRAATPNPVVSVSEFRVYAPVKIRRHFVEPIPKRTYKVSALYIYSKRNNTPGGTGHRHDFALLKLARPIRRRHYQPALLPQTSQHEPKPDETLYIAQFEHFSNGSLNLPLHIAPFVHKTDAQLRALGFGGVDLATICAVSPGFPTEFVSGVCFGDSGSGILRRLPNGKYMHLGVTAYMITSGCDQPGGRFFFPSTFYYKDDLRALFRGDESAWVKTV